MEILTILGILIVIVILGSFLNNIIPRIPAALFQIILGAAVTFIPNIPLNFEFESEMFMMLIIAPLLFTDGFNTSLKNIWLYKKPIIYNIPFGHDYPNITLPIGSSILFDAAKDKLIIKY